MFHIIHSPQIPESDPRSAVVESREKIFSLTGEIKKIKIDLNMAIQNKEKATEKGSVKGSGKCKH